MSKSAPTRGLRRQTGVTVNERRPSRSAGASSCYRLSSMNDKEVCEVGACCPDRDAPALPVDPDEAIAVLAKALAHPVRVRILRLLLARTECTCGEVVAELPLAQATVSHHLKILKEAGLVQGRVDGPRSCYCANPDHLAHLVDFVSDLTRIASVPA